MSKTTTLSVHHAFLYFSLPSLQKYDMNFTFYGGREQKATKFSFSLFRLRANGRNNSQHCCANNDGTCCVRVGSGVQTDAATPNNVGTYSTPWEGYNP